MMKISKQDKETLIKHKNRADYLIEELEKIGDKIRDAFPDSSFVSSLVGNMEWPYFTVEEFLNASDIEDCDD